MSLPAAPLIIASVFIAIGCTAAADPEGPAALASSETEAAPEVDSATIELAEPGASTGVTTHPDQPNLTPGDYTFELVHDERNRSYIMHVPDVGPGPFPVVIALHGGGGNGADFQDQNGLDVVADREGFVVVYPEGTGRLANRLHTWNSGDTCCGYAFDRGVDDVGFLRAVIEDLPTHLATDPGRIYMTGHSNGAMMSYRFAAEASDLVTAIAPVGGAVDLASPSPSATVALLHIHSADDPRALYEGGEGPPFPGTDRTVHHEPVLPGIQAWAATNGCNAGAQQIPSVAGTGTDEGHSIDRFSWSGCDQGGAVEHIVLHGSGHGWPGVTAPRSVQRHLGEPTTIINASEEIWAFVSPFDR